MIIQKLYKLKKTKKKERESTVAIHIVLKTNSDRELGVGDYNLAGATALADPCPLPSAAKKKGLRDKEKLFYAPMSGIGDLVHDKDAVYININDHFVQYSNVDNKNESMTHKGILLLVGAMFDT